MINFKVSFSTRHKPVGILRLRETTAESSFPDISYRGRFYDAFRMSLDKISVDYADGACIIQRWTHN